MRSLLHTAAIAISCALVGCATSEYSQLHPEANPQEAAFVRFLQEDGHITPSQIQSYLASNNIANSVSQNTWEGIDRWEIADWGSWTARYTGQKEELDGETFIIPGDINGMISSPRSSSDMISLKNASMHYYYDSMRQHSPNYETIFDRANDTAKTQNKALVGSAIHVPGSLRSGKFDPALPQL